MEVENNSIIINGHDDNDKAIEVLREFADRIAYRIIVSIMQSPKTAAQICVENKLPLSSTYKSIRKLYMKDIITIERIDIDNKGKKVVLYKSKIKSLAFNFKKETISLQIDKNDEQTRRSILI
jgi:predicted transcriptional regulator